MLRHLTFVEDGWFCETFGRPVHAAPLDPAADWRVEPHETTAALLAAYAETRLRADTVIDELGLEDTGAAWSEQTVTLPWVLVHMVEELARHADPAAAHRCYATASGLGTQLRLRTSDAPTTGSPGFALALTVAQPATVHACSSTTPSPRSCPPSRKEGRSSTASRSRCTSSSPASPPRGS